MDVTNVTTPQISRRIPKGNSSNILNIPSPPKEPKTNAALMNRTQYSKDVLGGWFMRDAPALVLIFLSLFKPFRVSLSWLYMSGFEAIGCNPNIKTEKDAR